MTASIYSASTWNRTYSWTAKEDHGDALFASEYKILLFFIKLVGKRYNKHVTQPNGFWNIQENIILYYNKFFLYLSKPAQLEGLEVDQYMWGILNTLNTSDVEEVTIDSAANWKPAKNLAQGIKTEEENESCGGNKKMSKAMSPGSMTLPTLNNWDNMSQAMSPYIPPDMNSELNPYY